MISKASGTFPVVEILSYYEKSACFNPNDREFIIKRGFWEWTLASMYGHTTGTVTEMRRTPGLTTGCTGKDLIVLIANLIGGGMDGANRKN